MQRLFYLEKKIDKPAKKSQKETKQGRGGKTYILSLERKKAGEREKRAHRILNHHMVTSKSSL